MNFFRKDERTQRNNWNKSAKSKKREMPILWDLWRIPVVQEVSKGFPFRLVNMPSFPCFAIALARPDDTIRNCLLPILPADQVIRLDFIINLVRNGCLEILRRRAFFNHRSIKIYQNDVLCDGMLVLVFFLMLLFFFHKDIFCLSDAGFRLQVFFFGNPWVADIFFGQAKTLLRGDKKSATLQRQSWCNWKHWDVPNWTS